MQVLSYNEKVNYYY